jgi:hypothetical protein
LPGGGGNGARQGSSREEMQFIHKIRIKLP